jgi:competence protein ComEA
MFVRFSKVLIFKEMRASLSWHSLCIMEERKEVSMRQIINKGLAISLILTLFVFPLLAQQSQAKKAPVGKININTATLEELQKLPRVGPKVAQRIIDFRKQNGNFTKIEELMKVRGIGEKTFAQMKDMLTV